MTFYQSTNLDNEELPAVSSRKSLLADADDNDDCVMGEKGCAIKSA